MSFDHVHSPSPTPPRCFSTSLWTQPPILALSLKNNKRVQFVLLLPGKETVLTVVSPLKLTNLSLLAAILSVFPQLGGNYTQMPFSMLGLWAYCQNLSNFICLSSSWLWDTHFLKAFTNSGSQNLSTSSCTQIIVAEP